MSSASPFDPPHIPLSQRAPDELRARATELRAMAATATTDDAKVALLTLADRFLGIAMRREAETLEAGYAGTDQEATGTRSSR